MALVRLAYNLHKAINSFGTSYRNISRISLKNCDADVVDVLSSPGTAWSILMRGGRDRVLLVIGVCVCVCVCVCACVCACV